MVPNSDDAAVRGGKIITAADGRDRRATAVRRPIHREARRPRATSPQRAGCVKRGADAPDAECDRRTIGRVPRSQPSKPPTHALHPKMVRRRPA